ncbi:MAG: polysaccharide biosynthesis C-terminal domain-containing protein [Lishizhenia sp.]
MGIVIKETIKGSVFQYLGILLGGLNVAILFPKLLGDTNWGVVSIIVSTITIFAQLSSLGSGPIVLKYFPSFSKDEKQKGFVSYTLRLTLYGILFFSSVLLLTKTYFFGDLFTNGEVNIALISLILGILFFTTLFNLVNSFIVINLKSGFSFFLKEFLIRFLQTLSVLLFAFLDLDLEIFLLLYMLSYTASTIIGFIHLIKHQFIRLKACFERTENLDRKEYFTYGLYTIVSGFGSAFVGNIDVIMLGALILNGEILAGKYKTAVYITALISIPLRPLFQIMYSLVSNWWKENKTSDIQRMYKQSTKIGLLISGSLLTFLLINITWLSNHIFTNLSDAFYIILFCGIGQLVSAATGINGTLINLSSYYKFTAYSVFILVLLNLSLNYWLIPLYQAEGAAIATGLSLVLFNLSKMVFVKLKLKMSVMNKDFFILLLLMSSSVIGVILLYKFGVLNMLNSCIISLVFSVILFSYFYLSGTFTKIKSIIAK